MQRLLDIEVEEYYGDEDDLEKQAEDLEKEKEDLEEEGNDLGQEGKDLEAKGESVDGKHDSKPLCGSSGTSKYLFGCSSGHCSCSNDTSPMSVTCHNCYSLLSL